MLRVTFPLFVVVYVYNWLRWPTCADPVSGATENAGMENVGPNRRVENAGPENARPNLAGVEKAGPPSMEREMDKCKCIMYR